MFFGSSKSNFDIAVVSNGIQIHELDKHHIFKKSKSYIN